MSDVLPRLTVQVDLLVDDGTLVERTPAFINRVVGPGLGVGYERRASWRYVLPSMVRSQGHGAAAALTALMHEDGLPDDALMRPEIRIYRLALYPLTESAPESLSDLPSLTKPSSPPSELAPAAASR